ncbi:C40 family peptidase [Cryobacterium sp. W22_MBD10_FK3]|uniref:C40 family peptidase n=1 Tax=Cryobacterium sp. W22_MBD10_FK3 TaxID=3240273 RepID=UPI003F8FC3D9
MTMTDALSRVGEIQARLVQLSDLAAGRVSATTTATTGAASATSFADALAAATGASTTGAIPNSTGATGTDIVAAAEKYLGVPYVFGGEDGTGMDCSGLVQRVYADMGIEVPRLVSGQMTIGTEVASLAEAKPGDLIVTGGGEHILIYAGNNQVIHAPYAGRTVCKVEAYMDDSEITTIRRVIPDQAASAALSGTALSGTALSGTAGSGAAGSSSNLVSAAFASLFNGGSSASALSTTGRSS